MKKNFILIFLFSVWCSVTNAQEDNYDINGFSVGIVPSALLNVWTGFQGEVNYGFADHYEISINGGNLYGQNKDTPFTGYRIRPSVKYYFLNDYEENRFYIEAGYLHRVVNEKVIDNYNMFQGAYQQKLLNNRSRTLNGGFAMIGTRTSLLSSNFYLDFGVGAGLGYITIAHDTLENGELIPTNALFSNTREGTSGFPILIMHLSIGYDF
jgi:hypothetical protein